MDETVSTQGQRTGLPDWAGLVVCLVICLGAGGLGAMATTPQIDGWYQTITKPDWNPPNQVFGPVY